MVMGKSSVREEFVAKMSCMMKVKNVREVAWT